MPGPTRYLSQRINHNPIFFFHSWNAQFTVETNREHSRICNEKALAVIITSHDDLEAFVGNYCHYSYKTNLIFWIFIQGILLLAGVHKVTREYLHELWSSSDGMPIFGATKKCCNICSLLWFDNKKDRLIRFESRQDSSNKNFFWFICSITSQNVFFI